MTDSMIERVARALAQADNGAPITWELYIEDARAVLTAMREPTTMMIISCGDLPGSQQEYWTRSIDAALAEPIG